MDQVRLFLALLSFSAFSSALAFICPPFFPLYYLFPYLPSLFSLSFSLSTLPLSTVFIYPPSLHYLYLPSLSPLSLTILPFSTSFM